MKKEDEVQQDEEYENKKQQNRHLIQNDVIFQLSVFHFSEQRFPRICLNNVPIISVQHFLLSILDYRHINSPGFPHFPIIIHFFYGESFGL